MPTRYARTRYSEIRIARNTIQIRTEHSSNPRDLYRPFRNCYVTLHYESLSVSAVRQDNVELVSARALNPRMVFTSPDDYFQNSPETSLSLPSAKL